MRSTRRKAVRFSRMNCPAGMRGVREDAPYTRHELRSAHELSFGRELTSAAARDYRYNFTRSPKTFRIASVRRFFSSPERS